MSIAIGSVVLGLAISAMHHTAMYFTTFFESSAAASVFSSVLDNEKLALIVMVSSFVLCGLFLLLAVPVSNEFINATNSDGSEQLMESNANGEILPSHASSSLTNDGTNKIRSMKIPYEQNSVVKYLSPNNIHAVKADGHYTCIYNGVDRLFCPWSISQMEETLDPTEFIRTHRSFLVNKIHIVGIKRSGDKTFCIVGTENGFEIPIARPHVNDLKKLLQTG